MHGQQPVCSLAEERELLAAGPPLPAHGGTGHLLAVLAACQERQVLQHEGGQLDSADLPPPPTLCTNLCHTTATATAATTVGWAAGMPF